MQHTSSSSYQPSCDKNGEGTVADKPVEGSSSCRNYDEEIPGQKELLYPSASDDTVESKIVEDSTSLSCSPVDHNNVGTMTKVFIQESILNYLCSLKCPCKTTWTPCADIIECFPCRQHRIHFEMSDGSITTDGSQGVTGIGIGGFTKDFQVPSNDQLIRICEHGVSINPAPVNEHYVSQCPTCYVDPSTKHATNNPNLMGEFRSTVKPLYDSDGGIVQEVYAEIGKFQFWLSNTYRDGVDREMHIERGESKSETVDSMTVSKESKDSFQMVDSSLMDKRIESGLESSALDLDQKVSVDTLDNNLIIALPITFSDQSSEMI